jgi:hypothetical protein
MPKTLPEKRQQSSESTHCNICGLEVRTCGLTSHLKKCEKQDREQQEDEQLADLIWIAEKRGKLPNVLKY